MLLARDSLQLAGRRFDLRADGDAPTLFSWNAQRAGYLDADATTLVRFARLRGDVYVAQFEILKQDSLAGVPLPPAGRHTFMITLVKLAPPRIIAMQPECAKYAEIASVARAHGVSIPEDRRREKIVGTREAILGFITATVACTPEMLEGIEMTAGAITPGGLELAAVGNPADTKNALALFEPRCNAGDLQVCFRIAQILQRGEGVKADPARAARLLEKVCHDSKGDVEACVDLAALHDRGEGVPKDSARATELLTKACAAGEMYGCDILKRRQ